ncbi:MAG: hypothetical protein WCA38_14510 [Candidatus Acidiferrales bacterium]
MRRPFGVSVVVILMGLGAGILLIGCVTLFSLGRLAVTLGDEGPMSALFAGMGVFGGIFFLLLAVVYGVLAVCLWQLRSWARPASVVCIAIGLMFAIIGILESMPNPVTGVLAWQIFVAAVDLGILGYLSRPSVVQAFEGHGRVESPALIPLQENGRHAL